MKTIPLTDEELDIIYLQICKDKKNNIINDITNSRELLFYALIQAKNKIQELNTKLLAGPDKILRCAFCGSKHELLKTHVLSCKKHPLNKKINDLNKQLAKARCLINRAVERLGEVDCENCKHLIDDKCNKPDTVDCETEFIFIKAALGEKKNNHG